MAVDIGYDLTSEEFDVEQPITGDVLVNIKKAQLKDTRTGGKMYILELVVTDGDDDPETGKSPIGKEFTSFLIFPAPHMKPDARGRFGRELRAFIEAVGEDAAEGAPLPEDIEGTVVAARCSPDTDRDGEPTTRVRKFFAESWWDERGTTE